MSAYTGADVQVVTRMLMVSDAETHREDALAILAAVAPGIAARALRDAADEIHDDLADAAVWSRVAQWLRARADTIGGDE